MVLQCSQCELLFVQKIPTSITGFYGDSYYRSPDHSTGIGYEDYERDCDWWYFAYRMALVNLITSKPGSSLVDLGSANGAFLELARAHRYEVFGVELSDWGAERTEQRGIPVISRDFLNIDTSLRFDTVTAWDFFEHIPDLRAAIDKAHEILNEAGFLYFELPCISEHSALPSDEQWYSTSLEHISYFTERTASNIFREAFGHDPFLLKVDFESQGSVLVGYIAKDQHLHEDALKLSAPLRRELILSGEFPEPRKLIDVMIFHYRFTNDIDASRRLGKRLTSSGPMDIQILMLQRLLEDLYRKQAWIEKLRGGKDWLETEWQSWKAVAEGNENLISELQEEKVQFENELNVWESRAEEQQRALMERTAEVEAVKHDLENALRHMDKLAENRWLRIGVRLGLLRATFPLPGPPIFHDPNQES